jgi:predicted GNAT family N-acyltransferase
MYNGIKFGKGWIEVAQLKKVEEFTVEITSLVAQCVYNPTDDKMKDIISLYESDSHLKLYAYYDGERVVAIIGLHTKSLDKIAVIRHIAVQQEVRSKGFGRRLVNEILSLHSVSSIQAETDKDAVNFYRSCGFEVKSLGELYPGVERFLCIK